MSPFWILLELRKMAVVSGGNWSYKTYKLRSNHHHQIQHPAIYRPDVLPVAQPTVSEHNTTERHKICQYWLRQRAEHLFQIWWKSVHRGLRGNQVKYNFIVTFLFTFFSEQRREQTPGRNDTSKTAIDLNVSNDMSDNRKSFSRLFHTEGPRTDKLRSL